MPQPPFLTPYEGVNAVLDRLLVDLRQVLGEQFVGLYLYGSLAGGDFNPETSDIDFLVVTVDPLPAETVQELEAMHARLWASGLAWAKKLEGSYLPQGLLRRYNPAVSTPWPTVNEGKFFLAPHGWDWVMQRYLLREHNTALVGPDLKPLIDPVGPEDLRRATREVLREWWVPMLVEGSEAEKILLQPAYQAHAVLMMCRTLHTYETGEMGSKRVAARWAQRRLGAPWNRLIGRARAWRENMPFDRMDEVRAFMRKVIEMVSKD